MRKNSLIRALLGALLALTFLLNACSFLDTPPRSETSTEIDSPDKIGELLAAAYPQRSYFRFLELRTDNVADKRNQLEASPLNDAMFHWRHFSEEGVDTPTDYWFDCYRGIAQANKALELLVSYEDKQDPHIQALYGEALLLRAYYHFMLVSIWAPPYAGPEASKTLPGIPYVEKPEKNAIVQYQQLSLQEDYDKIERDLRYGLAAVNDLYYPKPLFRFNKRAAYAFAVRFFSTVAKWDEVIDYASYILEPQPALTMPSIELMQIDLKLSETGLRNFYGSTQNPANLLITNTETLWYDSYINDLYGYDYDQKYNEITLVPLNSGRPYNPQFFSNHTQHNQSNSAYFPKFSEQLSAEGLLNAKRGHWSLNVLFSTQEVILARADAYAMINDFQHAYQDIATYYNNLHIFPKSGATPLNVTDLEVLPKIAAPIKPFFRPLSIYQSTVLAITSYYRQVQYLHEGLRWFDIRRYNLAVDRNRLGEPRDISKILRPEDVRKTLSLPDQVELIPFTASH